MCLVSIIVPVYNGEKYITRCVEHLIQQQFQEIEIIIVNDGSTDNTAQICDELKMRDSRIQVFHQNNEGPSSARNHGIRESKGTWITFVDVDDWMEVECISTAYAIAQKEKVDIVLWNLQEEIGNKIKKYAPFYGARREFQYDEIYKLKNMILLGESETSEPGLCLSAPYCKLIKKEIIGESQFPEEIDLSEDECFVLQLLDKVHSLIYINNIFYHRNLHYDSLSYKYDVNRDKRVLAHLRWILDYCKDYDKNILNYFVYRRYKGIVLYYIMTDLNLSYDERVKKITEFKNKIGWEINFELVKKDRYYDVVRYQKWMRLYVVSLIKNMLRVIYNNIKSNYREKVED